MEIGDFHVRDPDLLANLLYTQALGALNLLTLQLAVREHPAGLPVAEPVPFDEIDSLVQIAAVAMARGDRS
ncbi:MAG: TetR/AcrR family transcriptional regulator [Aeromicrobium sp.]|nr:TetR/AcrR family transcriptional regulator [Aeromicrobium sp.]